MRFTDNDIQDYLEGVFTGNVNALEEYINNTEEGRKRFESFKSLFSLLHEAPRPTLDIALGDSVMTALDARKTKPSFNWNILLWIITGCCIIGALISVYVFIGNFSFVNKVADSSLVVLIVIAIVLISLAFHGFDWYRQYRRYNKWLT